MKSGRLQESGVVEGEMDIKLILQSSLIISSSQKHYGNTVIKGNFA